MKHLKLSSNPDQDSEWCHFSSKLLQVIEHSAIPANAEGGTVNIHKLSSIPIRMNESPRFCHMFLKFKRRSGSDSEKWSIQIDLQENVNQCTIANRVNLTVMATRCLLHPAGKDICAESTHAQLRCVSRAQVPKLELKIEALGKKKCKIRKPGSSFRAQISRFSKVDKTEAELCVSPPEKGASYRESSDVYNSSSTLA